MIEFLKLFPKGDTSVVDDDLNILQYQIVCQASDTSPVCFHIDEFAGI